MDDNFGVLFQILLDKKEQAEIDSRLDSLIRKTEKVDETSTKGGKKVEEQAKKTAEAIKKEREAVQLLEYAYMKMSDATGVAVKTLKELPRELQKDAASVATLADKLSVLKTQLDKTRNTAEKLQKVGQGASLAGGAIVGSIFGAAVKEVGRQKKRTQ